LDFVIIFVILLLSHYQLLFHNNGDLSTQYRNAALLFIFANALVTVLVFTIFGIYKMLTTQFSLFDSLKVAVIAFSIQAIGCILEAIIFFVGKQELMGRPSWYFWVLSTISIVFLLPSVRIGARIFSIFINNRKKVNRERTAIIGAGGMAKLIIDDALNNANNPNKIVVLVDDNPNKIGGRFNGRPIVGPIKNIKEIIAEYEIKTVIIAIASLSKPKYRSILALLRDCPVRVKRAPLLSEMEGPRDVRIMDVDLDELLGREVIKLDNSNLPQMIAGRTVMVTGAGGSIGSELVRQIFDVKPKTLILFDIYENSTYDIQMELMRKIRKENINDVNVITLIGSTYNYQRMEQIISTYKPDYIYHAAAYKHVPLMEDSPQEAIRTNVIGTYNVAKLADKYGVRKIVLVSTDKAVRPTNVMGATKKLAEDIIYHFNGVSKNTKYAAVRFGNVLGSNGSVVPLFKKQIEAGGPVTVTDKNIIRYFMTIPEAVSLILQCGLFAEGGEKFILDMGKPVKIINLAEMMIRQAGYTPYEDIQIIETGLRPGEKLFEELLIDKTKQEKTKNNKIFVERENDSEYFDGMVEQISRSFEMNNIDEIKDALHTIVSSYARSK